MTLAHAPRTAYPATDPGYACVPVEELLAENADLIGRIKLCYGADRATFEHDVLVLIRRYATYVHLLPATADNYFSGPGGLLRLGLETGFFSLQGTDAHIFSGRSTISVRRQLEPRWRHATFIAGLCCELHRVLSHLRVTDADGQAWPGYLQPLACWLAARNATRYFLHWPPQAVDTRSLGVFTLPHVVPPEVLQHLSQDNTVIVPHLMASIAGVALYRDRNVLDELVRRSLALVIDRHLVANADRPGSPPFGAHLARYLVDTLRRLACGNLAWVPNRDKSCVWFGQDGLFLLWPKAAQDIHTLLEADQLAGIPKAPDTLLELLLAAGVFTAQDDQHPTWLIHPPGTKAALACVKLASPAILFSGTEPAPSALQQTLVRSPNDTAPAGTPAAPPAAVRPGTQLTLIPPGPASPPAATSPAAADHHPPSPPAADPAPRFALQAPLRLHPLVRDALVMVVHTLNQQQPDTARCCSTGSGVFVPLAALEQQGVQPALALRALTDVGMLARADAKAPPTQTREFNGLSTVGLVIASRFISGLDQDSSSPSTSRGP